MDIEVFRLYCMNKTGTEETFPFDESTMVFKVAGKMYSLCGLERFPLAINLKCDPSYAEELRENYPDTILPGYHMSKKHWNTIILESNLEEKMYFKLIDHSYDLVRSSLPIKLRLELEEMEKKDA